MAREGLMSRTTASLLCHRLRELSIAVASATQADTHPRNNLIMGRLGRFQFNFWKFFPSDEDPDDEDPGNPELEVPQPVRHFANVASARPSPPGTHHDSRVTWNDSLESVSLGNQTPQETDPLLGSGVQPPPRQAFHQVPAPAMMQPRPQQQVPRTPWSLAPPQPQSTNTHQPPIDVVTVNSMGESLPTAPSGVSTLAQ